MKANSSFAMPKSAFLLCFLFCSNFILSGKTAEQCPKNPLSPTNSASGMVIGVIVGTEKIVNGVISYFWYLGENSINQVIGLTSGLGGQISSITMKIHDYASGLFGAIGGQIKSIYSGSTGSIRLLFDSIIKLENSAQTFVYNQVENVADKVVSGKLTGEISAVIKNPFSSLFVGLKKAKGAVVKLSTTIKKDVKKMINKVETSGIPDDIKSILWSPVRGVEEFVEDTKSVIQTVKNETSQRISGYSSEFKNGNMIDKVVALSSLPVGITLEIWSFTLKISDAARKSLSLSVKGIVQPFLGQVLTERLGAIVNLPLEATEGLYKSIENFFCQIGGIISRVTGGGSLSVQINTVVKHPVSVLENAWNITKQDLKAFSDATIGQDLTEKLGNLFSSPAEALSSLMSSVTGGKFMVLLIKPIMYLKEIWLEVKMTLRGITEGLIGRKWTAKLFRVMNAPAESISYFAYLITGEGGFGTQINTVLTSPLQTIKNVLTLIKIEVGGFITSITGGGSIGDQLTTIFTKPLTLVKNIWYTAKETIKDISISFVGEGLTNTLGKTLTSPLSVLSNITASITGGGSLSTQLRTVVSEPLVVIQTIWRKSKNAADSFIKTLLGGNIGAKLSHLFSSPLATLSSLFRSFTSELSGLWQGFGASFIISFAGEGSIIAGIQSFLQAPIDVLKGTYRGIVNATKSLMNSFKGFYEGLIGGGGSIKADVNIGGYKSNGLFSYGGQSQSNGENGAKLGGRFSFGESTQDKTGKRR